MRKIQLSVGYVLLPGVLLFLTHLLQAQDKEINNTVVSFKKRELNTGVVFDMNKEKEELLTDETKFYEERSVFSGKYRLENRFWNLLDYKQEYFNAAFEVGALGTYGDWIDSSYVAHTVADKNAYGLRTSASIGYLNRSYYDTKNYTLVDVSGWGRFDWYKQHSSGTTIDSLGVEKDFDTRETENRLRYGFAAKAGWGVGRLSPMNHLMTADYLLRKYYPGRNFSDYEIAQLAQVIAEIKHKRDRKTTRLAEKEMATLNEFVKTTLLLATSNAYKNDWQYGEFAPRYQGSRFEAGPHFTYYNQEPDFVYGGYIQYENANYQNVKWNRNFAVVLKYDRYKKQDWIKGEVNLGWSYFHDLKSRFDFGVSYVPGIEIDGFDEVGKLSNNAIPYFAYFTQLNSKSRIKFDFAWRISDGEQFVLPGPEFGLSIYRSNY